MKKDFISFNLIPSCFLCPLICGHHRSKRLYTLKNGEISYDIKKSFRISVLPKSQALIKSRSGLKILNLNRLLLSGKNRNYRKSRKHWISSSRILQHCSMLRRCKYLYQEKTNSLKRRGTYLTVPLAFLISCLTSSRKSAYSIIL